MSKKTKPMNMTSALDYGRDIDPNENKITLPALPDTKDIRDLSRHVEKDIFTVYYTLMMDDGVPSGVRKACADALADRARGKPAGEAPQVAVQINNTFMPDEELLRRINFVQALVKENGQEQERS